MIDCFFYRYHLRVHNALYMFNLLHLCVSIWLFFYYIVIGLKPFSTPSFHKKVCLQKNFCVQNFNFTVLKMIKSILLCIDSFFREFAFDAFLFQRKTQKRNPLQGVFFLFSRTSPHLETIFCKDSLSQFFHHYFNVFPKGKPSVWGDSLENVRRLRFKDETLER